MQANVLEKVSLVPVVSVQAQTLFQLRRLKAPSNLINFGIGQPSPQLLPLDIMQQSITHRLPTAGPEFLQYGASQGYLSFRYARYEPGFCHTLEEVCADVMNYIS